MKKIRTFLAVDISPALRDRLAAVQADLRATLPSLRWIDPDSIHLTLKFLGSVSPSQLDEVVAALTPVVGQKETFVSGVRGLGVFPNERRPAVLWVGLHSDTADLQDLVSDLEAPLQTLGFAPDRKTFHPHLTLARVGSARENVGTILAQTGILEASRDFGSLEIDRITLFRSDLGASGSIYTALASMPLSRSEGREGNGEGLAAR